MHIFSNNIFNNINIGLTLFVPMKSFIYYFVFRSFTGDKKCGDTITRNDLVARQYKNLPYPLVSEHDISLEEQYYKNNEEASLIINPSITLENVNHYLHRGSENFR